MRTATAGPNGFPSLKDGFRNTLHEKSLKKFEVSFTVSRALDKPDLDEVKYLLSQQITKELLDYEIVDVEDLMTPYGQETIYRAKVYATMIPQKIAVTKYVYTVDNKDFSNKEVDEAMRNTYPERFL